MSDHTIAPRTAAPSAAERFGRSAPWILWVSALAALLTTIHHLHGARVYDTPGRYAAVWLAAGGIAIQAALVGIARSRDDRLAGYARIGFTAASLLFFVVLFGVVEGGFTHVVTPLLSGGYGPDEPFDALFEVTGILQVVPAAAIAALVLRARR